MLIETILLQKKFVMNKFLLETVTGNRGQGHGVYPSSSPGARGPVTMDNDQGQDVISLIEL